MVSEPAAVGVTYVMVVERRLDRTTHHYNIDSTTIYRYRVESQQTIL